MSGKGYGVSKIGALLLTAVVVALLIRAIPAVAASDAVEAQGIVERALATFNGFMVDRNYSWLHENLKRVKGVLIYPQVLKAGFILGGSGGTGVLVVRDEKANDWSQPAFYTVGSVTFGLQIGGQAAEVIVMVMSQKGIDSLLSSSVKLGGDTSVALGPYGTGAETNVTVDFFTFSKTKGIYAGINLNGSVVDVRTKLNKAYYGKDVTPVDIVVTQKVSNKDSAPLRAALKKAAK